MTTREDIGVHYDIEAVATVDARGQIVLPKSARQMLGLNAGSKLAVVVKRQGDTPCCITLLPANALQGRVQELIDAGTDHQD